MKLVLYIRIACVLAAIGAGLSLVSMVRLIFLLRGGSEPKRNEKRVSSLKGVAGGGWLLLNAMFMLMAIHFFTHDTQLWDGKDGLLASGAHASAFLGVLGGLGGFALGLVCTVWGWRSNYASNDWIKPLTGQTLAGLVLLGSIALLLVSNALHSFR